MSEIIVRNLELHDIPHVEALFAAILGELHEDNPAAFENYKAQYSALRLAELVADPTACLAVALQGEALVGFAFGKAPPSRVGFLHWMGVTPSMRGYGIGTQIFAWIRDAFFLRKKCHKIELYTYQQNSRLIDFYRKLGFSEVCRMNNHYYHLNIVHMAAHYLDVLLAGITDENKQDYIDWGPPVGKEIW